MAAETEIRELMAQLSQLGGGFANSRANAMAVGQAMARLRVEMQRGTGTVQQNAAALQRLMADFEGLDAVARRSTAGQAMLAEQTKMAGEIMRSAAGQMSGALLKGGIVEAVDYFRTQFFTAISSFQDGISGTEAAFRGQNAALESQIRILDRLSSGAALAAETLAMIPGPWAKVAAGGVGVVSFLATLGKTTSEVSKDGIAALQRELLTTTLGYEAQTKAGVVFKRGMTESYEAAQLMRLNMSELTKVITTNKRELSSFGGSVTGGYKRLVSVGKAIDGLGKEGLELRQELYRVGYQYDEQADGIADYIQMMNTAGQLNKKNSVELARESAAYMVNLKAVSAFTGEDAKSAEARARAASEQLAVQRALRKSQDPEAFEKFKTMVKLMPAEMTKGISQMTASGGVIVDKSLNQLLAASPTRKKLLDLTYQDMTTKGMSAAKVQENYERRVKEFADALAQESDAMADSYGMTTIMTGAYADVTKMGEEQADLARRGEAMKVKEIEAIGTTVDQFNRLRREGIDPLTNTIVNFNTMYKEDMVKVGTAMKESITRYALQPGKIPGQTKLREEQQNQQAILLEGIKGLGFLAEVPTLFDQVRQAYDKTNLSIGEGMNQIITGLSNVAGQLGTVAQDLGQVILNLARIPFKAKGGVTDGLSFAGEAGPELIMPMADGNRVNFRFPDVENYFDNLGANKSTTSPEQITQMVGNLFDNPNLMTNSIAELKNMISADSQSSQNLMKQYTEKMDTLIATLQQNVDYSKRIADGIA